LTYLNTLLSLLNEDYAKIVNMEEISEQSYDAMEAYLLAKKKASEKMDEAADLFNEKEKEYAKNNNINLILKETEIGIKLKKSAEVTDYYNKIYLIFFKSYKQEMYLLAGVEKNDINAIEQNRTTLINLPKQD